MALDNPIGAILQAAEAKNRNRQQANQDIASLGQSLGQSADVFAKQIQARKQKQQWQQTINGLINDPTVNPQLKQMLPLIAQHPELMGQLGPGLMKQQAPRPEYQAVPGIMSKGGKPFIFDKFTGDMKEGPMQATPTGGMGSAMAGVRKSQFALQDLPSNQGPTTAGGAAYQVKVGARQGKNLIARPGSPQRTAAATADLVRAITRVAPTDEGLKMANFSGNLVDRWARMKQQLTADPSVVDNPKIRKEMYDIFDEMDKSATPFVKMQLDNMEDAGFPVTPNTRKREMGETLPEIPYMESQMPAAGNPSAPGAPYQDPGKEARYQAWKKSQGL